MIKKISISLAAAILITYAVIASALFFEYGLPSLKGEIPEQLYSDSVTYEQAANIPELGNDLVSIGGNYLGPLIVLQFFDSNRISIHFFNISIILLSVLIGFRHLNVNRGIFLIGILSSPMLLFSTFGVNKEIFLLPLAICLLVYLKERTLIWLVLSLIAAIFVRWQMAIFVLLITLVTSNINPFQKKRLLTLIILVGTLSIAYPLFLSGPLGVIENISIEGAQDELGSKASGIYSKMQGIQRSYGYFLVVIPKTLQLLVGFLSRFSIASIHLDFWNNFVIMFQCLHNLLLIGCTIFCKKFDLSNDNLFLICVFAVMFSITPVMAPRYLYPIAIWLALWLASKNTTIKMATNISSV